MALSSEYPNYVKSVEVYFYDKNSKEERIKIYVEELSNTSKVQYLKKNNGAQKAADTGTGQGIWEYLSYATDEKDISKYTTLAEIARFFFEVQSAVNLVNGLQTNFSGSVQPAGGNGLLDACCEASDPSKCVCTCSKAGNKCCSSCVCCYKGSGGGTEGCCCSNASATGCKWEELRKSLKTFHYLRSNLYAPDANAYFTPVQAHISLLDADLESDFKKDDTNGGSGNGAVTPKKLAGTLVYGFVDYNYEPRKYSNDTLSKEIGIGSEIDTFSDSEDTYYGNFPQFYQYSLKNKKLIPMEDSDSTTDGSLKNNDLKKLYKGLEDKQVRVKYASKDPSALKPAKTAAASPTKCCLCCIKDGEEPDLDCIVRRNFVRKESSLSVFQEMVKNTKDCVTNSP